MVDKGPGIFVHPSSLDRGVPDCRTELETRLGKKVYNVHRIDRPASGLVVYALDPSSAACLATQFRNRTVSKGYLAIVRGHITRSLLVDSQITGGRHGRRLPAVTQITPLATSVVHEPVGRYREGWFSLVMAEIETGRPHQVRRHLRRAGHPVIGDTEHGDHAQNVFVADRVGFRRLGLLSYVLECTHPFSESRMRFCSGLSEWWRGYLECLDLDVPAHLELESSPLNRTSERRL